MWKREVDFLIIGSGFAGAATAFHLSRSAPGRIVIVEQEKTPGAHASGRNASLLVQSLEEPAIRRLAAESRLACCRHRTAAEDHRFVIGRDPRREGLFWVAGLWGYGVGCSWGVGRVAADLLLGRAQESAFDPARFTGGRA